MTKTHVYMLLLSLGLTIFCTANINAQIFNKRSVNKTIDKSKTIEIKSNYGFSLRNFQLNFLYKTKIRKNLGVRSSIQFPQINFAQTNNAESFSLRGLGLAIGLETNLLQTNFFNVYTGAELRANADIGGGRIFDTYALNAIIGIEAKVTDRFKIFGEVQRGLTTNGVSNVRRINTSPRANHVGFLIAFYS